MLRQESYISSDGSEDEFGYGPEYIFCDTLLRKSKKISIFPRNKKNMKKWSNIKSSMKMFNWFQYDKRSILASGYGYEIIRGINKNSGQGKLIKVVDCKILGGLSKAKSFVRLELNIHRTLERSECILKLENVFEANKKIYMVYEEGSPMSYHILTTH
jgi:hypothetical protein